MSTQEDHPPPSTDVSLRARFAVWLATGLGVGRHLPAPGTFGALWGLPLAWAVFQLPGLWWPLAAIAAVNLAGIPLTTSAGRALGGRKDDQAIVWDELATVPIVFLIVPLSGWSVALAGFALHRLFDISKPPPARRAERLPEGLGVMADDWVAAVYACIALGALAWLDRWLGFALLMTG